jgi:hypothetical protein
MFKRILFTTLLFCATSAFAQTADDLQKQVDELRRQIDVLTQSIEAMRATPAPSANATASRDSGISFGGYGEFRYNNPREGAPTADLVRGVLYTDYKFNPRVLFKSELEVEHASTERGGAVSLEFASLDYLIRPQLNVRAGVLLMPVGIINEQHEPTTYLGARRPLVEDVIIPTTWSEIGAGVFGEAGPFTYRSYVTTGMDARFFNAEDGIHEGKQGGSEALARDLAFVARGDWHPTEGTMFGGSFYTGGSGQGATTPLGERIKGRVRLGEVHADAKLRGLSLRGLVARGTLGDAAAINDLNGLDGAERIGGNFGGWYGEAGYDVLQRGAMSLTPYTRYESLRTNAENRRRVWTFGAAFKPIAQTVVKVDYERSRENNQWNIALGYIF